MKPTAAALAARFVILCASALCFGAAAPAQAADRDTLEVFLRLPDYGVALFGDVAVSADVYPPTATLDRVEFHLDGELAATIREAPWSTVLDVGQDNSAHEFTVRVVATDGRVATSTVKTPRLKTDDEVEIKLQQLYVAIENPSHQRVLDLGRGDFTVLDNGKHQKLMTFESGDVPFSAVLLLDASHSMQGGRLDTALRGAETFVAGMRELDQAKVMLHSDQLILETTFSSDAKGLTRSLAGAKAGGGTAINDHLYLALKRLETVEGRRVVILLSDGVDVESVLPIAHVRWMVRQLQPVIYWIRLAEGKASGRDPSQVDRRSFWRDSEGHRSEIRGLMDTVEESGGRIEVIHNLDEVETSFRWILEDLRNQYVLGYRPDAKADDDGRHEIEVRINRRGLDVRTRGSYLDAPRWTGDR